MGANRRGSGPCRSARCLRLACDSRPLPAPPAPAHPRQRRKRAGGEEVEEREEGGALLMQERGQRGGEEEKRR
eukprot:1561740-Rhodomonas_salina.1